MRAEVGWDRAAAERMGLWARWGVGARRVILGAGRLGVRLGGVGGE